MWPDTMVEENNLARQISALRKALDEHPNEHQYILTIPGRGYRFVANVRAVELGSEEFNEPALERLKGYPTGGVRGLNGQQAATAGTVSQPEGLSSQIKRRWRDLVVALVTLVVGITLSGWVVSLVRQSSQVDQPPPQRKLWQLTFDPGLESEPTWSPDGRLIAYSADRAGNFDLWVRPAGEGNSVRVTTSAAHDWQPDWAPEGNRLAFRSERDGGGLFVAPVLGGNERKVASFGYHPRWSPDGTRILFYNSILRNNIGEIPKVYLVGLDGKPPREMLPGFLPEFDSLRVAWHPDGERLSLWGRHRQQGWSFWTMPLAGGALIKSELAPQVQAQLREADVSFTDFRWSSAGRALYFEGVSRSVRNLWRVEVDPRSLSWVAGPERLTTSAGLDTDLALSSDGRKLAFTARTERTRLWSLPFDASAGRIKGAGQPVTAAGLDVSYPDLTPDGQKLVFQAQRAGREELWEKSLRDGRETLLMAADGLSRANLCWSRDGSRVAYRRLRPPNPEGTQVERAIVLLSAGGGEEQMLTTPGVSLDVPWDWSGDGQWILGGSDRQASGRRLICLFPLQAAPHAERQMRVVTSHPEENLYQARLSPDNRWVSFVAAKAIEAGVSTIYVVPASGGQWRRITEGKYFDDKPRWEPSGQRLYFISNRTGFFNVWGIRFDPASGQVVGEPFRVTAFESPGQMILTDVRILEMALASDRLVLPIMEVSGGIWILENVER
ncbi:MAG: winged helix-turn-helix domain-containing protein [Acidobacteria bacterium]|nr:winged helix-turn-helix domain-containing protein [Acidobacteriota bacterium]